MADASGCPVTPQSPFFTGSTGKSFTALAIMQLVEAGKIELDAPVKHSCPGSVLYEVELYSDNEQRPVPVTKLVENLNEEQKDLISRIAKVRV